MVPIAQNEILAFTYGHHRPSPPSDDQGGFSVESGPRTCVSSCNDLGDSPGRCNELEACAMVRFMTEGLLTAMLDRPDVYEIFDWLRGLSFIESGRTGLFPHDLVREAIAADLRWRNPDLYATLHHRARSYYHRRVQETHGQIQQRLLADLIFLHRDNSVVRPFYEWQDNDNLWMDQATDQDIPTLIELVRRHEGDESAQWAIHGAPARQRCHVIISARPWGMMLVCTAAIDDAAIRPRQRGLSATACHCAHRTNLLPLLAGGTLSGNLFGTKHLSPCQHPPRPLPTTFAARRLCHLCLCRDAAIPADFVWAALWRLWCDWRCCRLPPGWI